MSRRTPSKNCKVEIENAPKRRFWDGSAQATATKHASTTHRELRNSKSSSRGVTREKNGTAWKRKERQEPLEPGPAASSERMAQRNKEGGKGCGRSAVKRRAEQHPATPRTREALPAVRQQRIVAKLTVSHGPTATEHQQSTRTTTAGTGAALGHAAETIRTELARQSRRRPSTSLGRTR